MPFSDSISLYTLNLIGLARALIYEAMQSVVDWPLGKLTYGNAN